MRVCEGNVSIDRNVTVFGIKQANMQDNTPTGNSFNPGDNATLNVNMEIEDENAMHAVVSVRQGELQCQLSTVTVSGELNESFSQDQVSVENSFDNVSGVATVSDSRIAGIDLSTDQSIPAIGLQGLFGVVASQAESDVGGDVVHASATVVSDSADANVTVQTLDSWPNDEYQYVHVAVGNESDGIVSSAGTVTLSRSDETDSSDDGTDSGDGGEDDGATIATVVTRPKPTTVTRPK
jgi:hypothetical protein